MFPASYVNSTIFDNLLICRNILAEDRDYLHMHINLLNILPFTTNGTMQCNWAQHSLDENSHFLNKRTTSL